MTQIFQRLTAVALIAMLAAPVSAFAENRSRQRTDMHQLAQDLERALGKKQVAQAGLDADSLVAAMNRERAARGLGPLRINARLAQAAGDRVNDMFAKHYFDHVAPDGLDPFTWVDRRGYAYRLIGENLAIGYRTSGTVVDGWMHSPGHRAKILGSGFDEVGVAFVDGSPVRGYRAPLVVALYGTR